MIRNVVMGRLTTGGDAAARCEAADRLDAGLAGIAALELPGQLSVHVGLDVGIRPGGWSFAITSDWVDVAAYQAYDLDIEHNRYRRMIVDACEEVARVQFSIG